MSNTISKKSIPEACYFNYKKGRKSYDILIPTTENTALLFKIYIFIVVYHTNFNASPIITKILRKTKSTRDFNENGPAPFVLVPAIFLASFNRVPMYQTGPILFVNSNP